MIIQIVILTSMYKLTFEGGYTTLAYLKSFWGKAFWQDEQGYELDESKVLYYEEI